MTKCDWLNDLFWIPASDFCLDKEIILTLVGAGRDGGRETNWTDRQTDWVNQKQISINITNNATAATATAIVTTAPSSQQINGQAEREETVADRSCGSPTLRLMNKDLTNR